MSNSPTVDNIRVQLSSTGNFDREIYDSDDKFKGYFSTLPSTDIVDDDKDIHSSNQRFNFSSGGNQNLSRSFLSNINDDPILEAQAKLKITNREDAYHLRNRDNANYIISPLRYDEFADLGKTPIGVTDKRIYKDILQEQNLAKEEHLIHQKIKKKYDEGQLNVVPTKRARWDSHGNVKNKNVSSATPDYFGFTPSFTPSNDSLKSNPSSSSFKIHPNTMTPNATPGTVYIFPSTPGQLSPEKSPAKINDWETPKDTESTVSKLPYTAEISTPSYRHSKSRSRWDEEPNMDDSTCLSTPDLSSTRGGTPGFQSTPSLSSNLTSPAFLANEDTPLGSLAINMSTPLTSFMTPDKMKEIRWNIELDERNRYITDEELNALLPSAGYEILIPPDGYLKSVTPNRKLHATPTPASMTGFHIQVEDLYKSKNFSDQPSGNLPFLKQEDIQYFGKLLNDVDENTLSLEDQKEIKIMRLLLKIKNGTPPMRKSALRQITDKSREFGAASLFHQILPLLMSPSLEDQERHLLVKVIDRILYKLDDLVRPFVHKILVVIEPLLIDEDYYARVEGREIISNLAKAAGLATMISTMRPDIDNIDEYVRNTTARAFAVVASALGIPSLLPFLRAVCRSKKSWQARHTGIKIIQQIAILMGCAILPYLKSLVEIIERGLVDEQQKVRTITALALAALAESATPYGIESFDTVLVPLWKGIRTHRGKGLAAFLKAIGYLIPLMDKESSKYYTREVMLILVREFTSPDAETKKIVLKVVKQCCSTEGVEASYIRQEVLPHFFKHFWNQRMGADRRNHKQLVDTTVEIGGKVGGSDIIRRIVDDLKEENENYRKMVMECVENILLNFGASDIDARLEEQLIDGIMYAFQEQSTEDVVMLNGFGVVVNGLGTRVKPYLPQICGTILWRLNNKSPKVRQQAADLISKISSVMKECMEEKLMGHLGVILYEYLGEEYPEVLGSILGALKSIVNVIGMTKMTPPIKDLLPRLSPILRNRHEKVQENCIDLVGRIADRGSDYVQPREWMRICVELLDLLKAHKKAIRRATVNTFGYIAKAIGPQDVLATLLTNLRVQERQNRVCTTVAIAIVAETCSPFTIIPGLMNEYRVPELNVQHGVLKSLSFLFEYIGEMGKDYIYSVTPLLEDALMDRDLVHRQTSCSAVKHMSLGVFGLGCEDALNHLLNFVWPNLFEISPHMVMAVRDAIEGISFALGPIKIHLYLLQGLFHPARKVRDVYWRHYNSLYISFQHALVVSYPTICNDQNNNYVRTHLFYTI